MEETAAAGIDGECNVEHEDGASVAASLTKAAHRAPRVRDGFKAVAGWQDRDGSLSIT